MSDSFAFPNSRQNDQSQACSETGRSMCSRLQMWKGGRGSERSQRPRKRNRSDDLLASCHCHCGSGDAALRTRVCEKMVVRLPKTTMSFACYATRRRERPVRGNRVVDPWCFWSRAPLPSLATILRAPAIWRQGLPCITSTPCRNPTPKQACAIGLFRDGTVLCYQRTKGGWRLYRSCRDTGAGKPNVAASN